MAAADDVIDRLAEAAASAPPNVLAAYLFGSVARGTSTPSSDLDIGVLLESHSADDPIPETWIDALEAAGRRPIDLVVLNRAAADLTHRVLRDGVLLLDRAPAARLSFEVQTRNEFFDLDPIRRTYRTRTPPPVITP